MAIQWRPWMRWIGGGLWNPDKGRQQAGPETYANNAGQPMNDALALQISAVFRCIRIIAETAASLPMHSYKVLAGGDRAPLEDSHPVNRLIYEPNEEMQGDEIRESLFGQMAGWGNGYAQSVPQSEGKIVELWPYKPDAMRVDRREDRTLKYTYPGMSGTPDELPKGRVFHLRGFSLDGVMGLSPLTMARQALGMSVAARDYGARFFANGGRPAGILSSDNTLTDKQREQLRAELSGIADGSNGKNFYTLERGLKYSAITVSPEDMQMLQTQAFSIAEIARFFGVPLFLLMETEKSTSWGSGIEQQNIGFLTYTLRPYLTRMVGTWNRRLIPKEDRGKIIVDIDESPLMTMDSAALKEFASTLVNNGLSSRNDVRVKYLKLPRVPDKNMNAYTVQTALTPIEALGRIPAPTQPNPG